MSYTQAEVITDALTRSNARRDKLGVSGSDEELLRRLGPQLDARQLSVLAATSRLLRLMDALLAGSETGEGFVEKFSRLWGSMKPVHGRDLGPLTAQLDEFYGDIQLFCAAERDRREVPSLFGLDRLKALTEVVYAQLRRWWCDNLTLGT